jgi:hypothetical protein
LFGHHETNLAFAPTAHRDSLIDIIRLDDLVLMHHNSRDTMRIEYHKIEGVFGINMITENFVIGRFAVDYVNDLEHNQSLHFAVIWARAFLASSSLG